MARRRPVRLAVAAAIGVALVACLVLGVMVGQPNVDRESEARAEAGYAIRALRNGDLSGLESRLAAQRGRTDFAYFFASQATPRSLGDALATGAARSRASHLRSGVGPHAYELALTDLAGTLALATHGSGDRTLPLSWTRNFVEATTTPRLSYADPSNAEGADAKTRHDQDAANKQNLLLLLARGYWSLDFLKATTAAYWTFDRAEGDEAWPGPTLSDAHYAPAPNGTYLTDGVLALTAALTANPAASAWAFTEFQPGTATISYDDSEHKIGRFTHFLLFEHHFPKSRGDDHNSLGMTAVLTALSSAIDGTNDGAAIREASAGGVPEGRGPLADTQVLQSLAKSLRAGSGCSWNPVDYGRCVIAGAEAVLHLIEHWGHTFLDILSLTTFAPPPFVALGVAAAVSNATWYAVDGDYAAAGLSLATAVSGLAFAKIAEGARAGAEAEQAASEMARVSDAAEKASASVRAVDNLKLAESGAMKVVKGSPKYSLEKEAQAALAAKTRGSVTERTFRDVVGCTHACEVSRRVDVLVPRSQTALEVKIGIRNVQFALSEIERDSKLLLDPAADVKVVVWHFFPDARGVVGPNAAIRTELVRYGIRYVMHVP